MGSSSQYAKDLRSSWRGVSDALSDDDYRLLARAGCGYAAITREGRYAVVIPLDAIEQPAVGRRAAGCELMPVGAARFRFEGRDWQSPAAVLSCLEHEVVEAFTVLAADVLDRIGDLPTWRRVLEIVEEWQSLLSASGRLTPEGEVGLWGELWFLSEASDVPMLLAGWRGPEKDATDFFIGDVSAEVKTSRYRRRHHVSLSQVQAPVGDSAAWFLSIWVKEDPMRGTTVSEIVTKVEGKCADHGELHRRLLGAGYRHSLANSYTARYVVLDREWYAAASIPAVREADPGVSEIRYRVTLDEELAADEDRARVLWIHFWAREPDPGVG